MAELETERGVCLGNLEDWRRMHMGEFVLIKGSEVIGFFQTLNEAFDKGTSLFGLQPFFVHQISPEDAVNISFCGARVLSA